MAYLQCFRVPTFQWCQLCSILIWTWIADTDTKSVLYRTISGVVSSWCDLYSYTYLDNLLTTKAHFPNPLVGPLHARYCTCSLLE